MAAARQAPSCILDGIVRGEYEVDSQFGDEISKPAIEIRVLDTRQAAVVALKAEAAEVLDTGRAEKLDVERIPKGLVDFQGVFRPTGEDENPSPAARVLG